MIINISQPVNIRLIIEGQTKAAIDHCINQVSQQNLRQLVSGSGLH